MNEGLKILGIIPARGGSKGIVKKNLYPLMGLPLVQYTIRAGQKSQMLSHLIVSTDSTAIATLASQCGVDVPFIRPPELSTDGALAIDVIKHALLSEEATRGFQYDVVVMLQPTSPLRSADDIDAVLRVLITQHCDSVVSMVEVGANHPARMYMVVDNKLRNVMNEGVIMGPRQDLPPIFIRNGAIYACNRETLFKHDALISPNCRPYIMPKYRSVNIDTFEDIVLAEYYLDRMEIEALATATGV